MIITISGRQGAGKSTVAEKLAKKLGYKFCSMGDLRGRIAIKHRLTIDELNEIGKRNIWTDKEADDELIRIGKEENNYVIDTWIGYHFIPNSKKIFLDVDSMAGAKRIFRHQRPDEQKKDSIKELKEMLEKRLHDSWKRYKKYYKIDFLNKKNYDLVIDTTNLTADETVNKILLFIKKK
jgi:cytidylate kinase